MKKEYDIKKELKRLASIKGSGTELISIYVPPDFQITDEIAKLKEEHGQASNIKSKTTKQNVQDAISKIIQYLKLYKTPPPTGLVVFCGNISNVQANPDVELFSMEPPQPIKMNIYRCDSTFLLGPMETMLEAKDMYALLVMDGRDATIGVLRGTHVTVEKRVRSFAHAKVRKGGQSAARYERAIEESIDDYYKSIGDAINAMFAKYDFKLRGLVVGGPGPTKENFVRSKVLNYQIKVLGTFDTGYTDDNMGINELLERSKEVLSEQAAVQERKIMDRFLSEVSRNGLAVYGYKAVKDALSSGNIVKLIVSDDVSFNEVKYRCTVDGTEFTVVEEGQTRRTKHECGGNLDILSEKDAVDDLIDMADKRGVETVFVAAESQYGKELLMGFHGIAAMLKYR